MTMEIIKRASISPCHNYRYRLTRYWGPGYMLPFVMLNPSTADASDDDPTIRRCMAFARRERAGGIVVANVYAYRATSPAIMKAAADPFGPKNGNALWEVGIEAVATKMPIVCAWGTHGGEGVAPAVRLLSEAGADLVCLGRTVKGHPRHPLYVAGHQPFEAFTP